MENMQNCKIVLCRSRRKEKKKKLRKKNFNYSDCGFSIFVNNIMTLTIWYPFSKMDGSKHNQKCKCYYLYTNIDIVVDVIVDNL